MRAALLAVLALAACGERADWVTQESRLSGPVALGRCLYWVEETRGELLAVDVLATDPGELVTRYPLGKRPGAPMAVPPADGLSPPSVLAVLVPGERELHLLSEPAEDGAPSHRVLALGQAYDRLELSPDGAWGLAWMGPAAEQAEFVTQPGKVAVVELAAALAGEAGAVTERSLNLEVAPEEVAFSRPLPLLGGGEVSLAAVVSPTRIAVVDLGEAGRRARTIFLDEGVSPRTLRFTDGLAEQAEAEFLLFNADGDAGISAYAIQGEAAPAAGEPRIRLTYHQLLPDDPPADYAVFPGPGGRRYVLVSVGRGASRATVMESLTTPVGTPVELSGGPVNRVSRAPGADGTDVALLYDDGGRNQRLQVLSLPAGGDDRPEVAATEAFAAPVAEVRTLAGQPGLALVFLRNEAQLELVDLGTQRSQPVRLLRRPEGMVWDRRGSELYLAASGGSSEGLLVRLRLEGTSVGVESVELDAAPRAAYLLEERGVAVIDHGAAQGLLTVVEVADLRRERARVLDGVFLTGLLDVAGGR